MFFNFIIYAFLFCNLFSYAHPDYVLNEGSGSKSKLRFVKEYFDENSANSANSEFEKTFKELKEVKKSNWFMNAIHSFQMNSYLKKLSSLGLKDTPTDLESSFVESYNAWEANYLNQFSQDFTSATSTNKENLVEKLNIKQNEKIIRKLLEKRSSSDFSEEKDIEEFKSCYNKKFGLDKDYEKKSGFVKFFANLWYSFKLWLMVGRFASFIEENTNLNFEKPEDASANNAKVEKFIAEIFSLPDLSHFNFPRLLKKSGLKGRVKIIEYFTKTQNDSDHDFNYSLEDASSILPSNAPLNNRQETIPNYKKDQRAVRIIESSMSADHLLANNNSFKNQNDDENYTYNSKNNNSNFQSIDERHGQRNIVLLQNKPTQYIYDEEQNLYWLKLILYIIYHDHHSMLSLLTSNSQSNHSLFNSNPTDQNALARNSFETNGFERNLLTRNSFILDKQKQDMLFSAMHYVATHFHFSFSFWINLISPQLGGVVDFFCKHPVYAINSSNSSLGLGSSLLFITDKKKFSSQQAKYNPAMCQEFTIFENQSQENNNRNNNRNIEFSQNNGLMLLTMNNQEDKEQNNERRSTSSKECFLVSEEYNLAMRQGFKMFENPSKENNNINIELSQNNDLMLLTMNNQEDKEQNNESGSTSSKDSDYEVDDANDDANDNDVSYDKEYKEKILAAIKIQSIARQYQSQKFARLKQENANRKLDEEQSAAIKIQSIARQYKAKQEFARLKQEANRKLDEEQSAAIKIQSIASQYQPQESARLKQENEVNSSSEDEEEEECEEHEQKSVNSDNSQNDDNEQNSPLTYDNTCKFNQGESSPENSRQNNSNNFQRTTGQGAFGSVSPNHAANDALNDDSNHLNNNYSAQRQLFSANPSPSPSNFRKVQDVTNDISSIHNNLVHNIASPLKKTNSDAKGQIPLNDSYSPFGYSSSRSKAKLETYDHVSSQVDCYLVTNSKKRAPIQIFSKKIDWSKTESRTDCGQNDKSFSLKKPNSSSTFLPQSVFSNSRRESKPFTADQIHQAIENNTLNNLIKLENYCADNIILRSFEHISDIVEDPHNLTTEAQNALQKLNFKPPVTPMSRLNQKRCQHANNQDANNQNDDSVSHDSSEQEFSLSERKVLSPVEQRINDRKKTLQYNQRINDRKKTLQYYQTKDYGQEQFPGVDMVVSQPNSKNSSTNSSFGNADVLHEGDTTNLIRSPFDRNFNSANAPTKVVRNLSIISSPKNANQNNPKKNNSATHSGVLNRTNILNNNRQVGGPASGNGIRNLTRNDSNNSATSTVTSNSSLKNNRKGEADVRFQSFNRNNAATHAALHAIKHVASDNVANFNRNNSGANALPPKSASRNDSFNGVTCFKKKPKLISGENSLGSRRSSGIPELSDDGLSSNNSDKKAEEEKKKRNNLSQ